LGKVQITIEKPAIYKKINNINDKTTQAKQTYNNVPTLKL